MSSREKRGVSSPFLYTAYDDFAWVYNKHWGSAFIPTAIAVLEEKAFPALPPGASILDLCCGTGQLAKELCERGYRVTGIDGSKKMLGYARRRTKKPTFIVGDARDFAVGEQFDLVVSMFDSLNHIMNISELAAVFRGVHRSLKDTGLFLFDMNTETGYVSNWQGHHGIIKDDHVCIFPNSYDSDSKVAAADFTVFRFREDGWRRTDFQLTQRCYPTGLLLQTLRSAGFSAVDTFSFDKAKGCGTFDGESRKAFFLCRKD